MSINTPPDSAFVEHGTAVAAAVLYGPLNSFAASDVLPPPPVSVTSFRALPTSDPLDVDLYESIDVIERVVPARPDIKVYNISFGPVGQIEDDCLSRFTYSLDQLAHSHKVAFYIAVGNDGEVIGENRIQSPSDLANGCGVAAHTRAILPEPLIDLVSNFGARKVDSGANLVLQISDDESYLSRP